jgi:hypothetical protein
VFASPPPGSPPPPDTTQKRIADALASHRIDYPTSLAYRFDALDGSDELPTAYQAPATLNEDPTLFAEATDSSLNATDRARLAPFVVRPDDPASVFSGSATPVPAGRLVTQGYPDVTCQPNGWATVDSVAHPYAFHVLAQCVGSYGADLATAVATLDALWGPMTSLMGAPAPLAGVSDGGIEVFLLSPGDYVTSGGSKHRIAPGALAMAVAAAPFQGNTSSGFLELGRARMGDAIAFRSDLAHEFFHILEYAHNETLLAHKVNGKWTRDWFPEASSVWAEYHFVPEARATEEYPRFVDVFSQSDLSLLAGGPLGTAESRHMYASFVWPLFMEQQRGALVIGATWKALETASNGSDEVRTLNDMLGFHTYYREFAMQALDIAGLPSPNFQAQDHAFPRVAPRLEVDGTLDAQPHDQPPLYTFRELRLAPLAMHFLHLRPGAGTHKVALDLTKLESPSDWDMDALVHRNGTWVWQRGLDGNAQICNADAIDELYLVLADHSTVSAVSGTVDLKADRVPCGQTETSPSTSVSAGGSESGAHSETGTDQTYTGSFLPRQSAVDYKFKYVTNTITLTVHPDGSADGSYSVSWTQNDTYLSPDVFPDCVETYSASGTLKLTADQAGTGTITNLNEAVPSVSHCGNGDGSYGHSRGGWRLNSHDAKGAQGGVDVYGSAFAFSLPPG